MFDLPQNITLISSQYLAAVSKGWSFVRACIKSVFKNNFAHVHVVRKLLFIQFCCIITIGKYQELFRKSIVIYSRTGIRVLAIRHWSTRFAIYFVYLLAVGCACMTWWCNIETCVSQCRCAIHCTADNVGARKRLSCSLEHERSHI